ncbi:adenine-specific DNA methylase [mine drainage metagenome]|uniref:Adenine-specific DNA methylase n=1 Tax=mine drainage metagenome TaxID=410659 RepID=T1AAD0_9ZZZZ
MNILYYGDNLDILRRKIRDETIDLCYIDPPFNSKRNYNQIYNNVGEEDRAQAHAFTDTWTWDEYAIAGHAEILANDHGRFQSKLVELIKGLQAVLGNGSLFAYLVSMSLRLTEIHRVLKPDGTFFLHCDPTASHYLKLILDTIFVPQGGDYLNELVWCYSQGGRSKSWFPRKHDIIFWYSKGKEWTFNIKDIRVKYELLSQKSQTSFTKSDADGRKYKEIYGPGKHKLYKYYEDEGKVPYDWWTDIHQMTGRTAASRNEYLGYPTQKPEALLERLILAASDEGDTVLDAYCGCGTTVAVAQRLKRKWIGMDITYQSISLVLRRLESKFGKVVFDKIVTDGIPRDMKSAIALAHKQDDRLRKEFEKWAVLTYTNNRAIINEKKGADAGIDAIAYFMTGKNDNAKIIFQVKSGGVKRGDIATLRGDMGRESAALAVLITLEEPSKPMTAEAKAAGQYHHETMGRDYDKIGIVTIRDIVAGAKRLEIPMSLEVLGGGRNVQPNPSR